MASSKKAQAVQSKLSRVRDVGMQCGSCGYCHSAKETSISHGMLATDLTVEDYQDLIDLGWRRSGTYLYKPDPEQTCCPPYTIRMWANQFKPNKDQAKRLRKLAEHLSGSSTPAAAQPSPTTTAQAKPRSDKAAHKQSQDGSQSVATCVLRQVLTVMLQQVPQVLQAEGGMPQVDLPAIVLTPPSHSQHHQKKQKHKSQPGTLPALPTPAPAAAISGPAPDAPSDPSHHLLRLSSPSCLAICAAIKRAAGAQQHNNTSPPTCPAPASTTTTTTTAVAAPATQTADFTPAALADRFTQYFTALVTAVCDCLAPPDNSASSSTPTTPPPDHTSPAFQHAVRSLVDWLQHSTHAAAGTTSMLIDSNGTETDSSNVLPRDITIPAALPDIVRSLTRCEATAAGGYINLSLPCLPQVLAPAQQQQQPAGPQQQQQVNGSPGKASVQGMDVDDQSVVSAAGDMLEVTIQPSSFIQEEYELYKRYQMSQHGDDESDASEAQYTRFLVESPLLHVPSPAAAAAATTTPVAKQRSSSSSKGGASAAPGAGAARPASAAGGGAGVGKRGMVGEAGEVVVTAEAALAALEPTSPATVAGGRSGAGGEAGAQTVGGSTAQSQGGQAVSAGGQQGVQQVPACGYGSFHMQYRWNGKLVAVGVVDVLPRCMSGVYLFWDPGLRHLGLGKLTALFEILWVQQASKVCPGLQWYYMGFYIPTCHKMRYKGEYAPSDLLCPTTKTWVGLSPTVLDTVLNNPRHCNLATLPACTVYRNWAHTPQETAAAAAQLGLQLDPASGDMLVTADQQQPARTEAGAAQTGTPSAAASAPGGSRGGGVKLLKRSADDLQVYLWKQTQKWQVYKQYLEDETVKAVQEQMEAWMRLVGGCQDVWCTACNEGHVCVVPGPCCLACHSACRGNV